MLFGDVDCRNYILVVLVTATAVATTDLVETQHFVNDWTGEQIRSLHLPATTCLLLECYSLLCYSS